MSEKTFLEISMEEVELRSVIRLLWKRRLILAIVITLTVVLGILYSFTVKDTWVSKVKLTKASPNQLGEAIALSKMLIVKEEGVGDLFATYAFDRMSGFLSSTNVKVDFLKGTKILDEKMLVAAEASDERLNAIAQHYISVKKENDGIVVGVRAYSALDAQKYLADFVDNVNSRVVADLVDSAISVLNAQKLQMEDRIAANRQSELMELEQALVIAKTANVRDIQPNNLTIISNNKRDDLGIDKRLYLMGEKLLKAQIEVLKREGAIQDSRYLETVRALNTIGKIKKDGAKVRVYNYQDEPLTPLKRDSPNLSLIIVLCLLGGIFISIFGVLGHAFFERHLKG